jgi:hypothetical protein
LQSNQHQTLIIEEFEPDVFRQLIEYIHTGCVTLQPRTLLGELITKLNLAPCRRECEMQRAAGSAYGRAPSSNVKPLFGLLRSGEIIKFQLNYQTTAPFPQKER